MWWIAVFMPEVPPPSRHAAQAVQAAPLAHMVSHAALTFSPMVSLAPPHTVLLEAQASLRLWGGQGALLTHLSQVLNALPGAVRWQGAVAPTPLAATWLAQCAGPLQGFAQTHAHELKAALSVLPVHVLASSAVHQATLEHLGLYTLGHLWRLPRYGMSRRFGPALLQELDRALGLKPDPRPPVVLPDSFDQRFDLWEHTDSSALLLEATKGLLAHLGVWLLARQMLVSVLELVLHPTPRLQRIGEQADAQVLRLALGQPTRDMAHLALLLRERLNRLTLHEPLAHPVAALTLRALQLVKATTADAQTSTPQLFVAPANARSDLNRLVERLQARLGVDHVQGLVLYADHRPERATRLTPPKLGVTQRTRSSQAATSQALQPPPNLQHTQRPSCLLAQPQALPMRQGQPCVGGQPLRLLAGPERIETGWWGDDELGDEPAWLTQRDYFVAESHTHALLWVFCEPGQGVTGPNGGGASDRASSGWRWFLHGHFG